MAKNKDKNALMPMKTIIGEFRGHYASASSAELDDHEPARIPRLRVSGFPFCGLEAAYKRLTNDKVERKMTFGSRYYTGVGTLTHEIIQEWMGRSGRILGQWKCKTEGCKGVRLISRKNICPICKGFMAYEELTVTAFKYVSGHLDGIYRAENGEYFVIDYKTSSVRVITTQHENRTLPYYHNVCQIKAYCALIELLFEIKISGWMLHYIARDNPLTTYRTEGKRVSDEEKKEILVKIKGYDRHWGMVINMHKFSDLMQLVEEKPCRNREFYMKEFHGYTPCPLSQGDMCFQPKKLERLLKIVWSDRPRTVNNK